ncbi:hypothetical protein EYZ11_008236 [Aspergillus tanneri]|uniref:Fe2OG dioxygenase domain-containing protein n=1 Tax=Aspergillus tanneri TaxID=1220188 RepID=A0A4S3JB06_9EURO|nr:uncharacterized protein ATNIH1004_007981 [Aspergillus tanneri]KAA8646548.1 hypothetical protein ATNIH1004_007981 [Aspergillus tanneri]THC92286.1 hypothetical protein EYZ11_008236 [Aspergillus tanneri]
MSFFSQFGDLPTIQTRKALLLLDFQNDFLRSSGAVYVSNASEFLETLPQLASAFRHNGEVVWVRSYYESRRPLVGRDLQELVVLSRAGDASGKGSFAEESVDPVSLEPKGPVDDEAFLSTETAQCCRPQTAGAQFPAPILAAIDTDADTLVEKSEYSALQDQGLILSLRTRFVTELYLCGSLSNVSVYATALDAVRHGFSVNLIEDRLGFRSFGRHEEAMRRMADIFGANGITADELFEELDWQETDAIAREGSSSTPARSVTPAGIEGDMGGLDFRRTRKLTGMDDPPASLERGGTRRNLDDILAERSDDEDGDLLELANLTRGNSRYTRAVQDSDPTQQPGDKGVRPRMRRSKGSDPKVPGSSRPEARRSGKQPKRSQAACKPGDKIGEGDSRIVHDLDLPAEAFEQISGEVAWQKMYHLSGQVPRLVAVQGRPLEDGSVPIYRHPADESPPFQSFTPAVDRVRAVVERILGHPLNHVLIQLYRDGQDRISEHSDKTLDIVRGSSICNVSLGAQRVMVLRSKAQPAEGDSGRHSQRVPMPHESLFILGEKTNMRWLHGIRPDKRPDSERSIEERAYGGKRISLTFRHIGTFLNPSGDTIWGQGAVSKDQDRANPVIHGDSAETERLIRAFGEENRSIEFDWDAIYGDGFDVVNFVTASTVKLVLGSDQVANLRVLLCLGENGIRYDTVTEDDDDAGTVRESSKQIAERPLYIGPNGVAIAGDVKIMTDLARRSPDMTRPGVEVLRGGSQLAEIDELLAHWREHKSQKKSNEFNSLDEWEKALSGQSYLDGATFGIDDCSLWPVLREIVQENGSFSNKTHPNLLLYYTRLEKRGVIRKTLEEMK